MTSRFPDRRHRRFFFFFFFFWRCFVSFVKSSYWFKFHVSIITGSSIMIIFFYKGLTRNPETSHAWFLPNIWRLGRVVDAKFDTNVSNIMLLNDVKIQGYSFYCFWVIKRKSIGGEEGGVEVGEVKLPTPPPTQVRVNREVRNKVKELGNITDSKSGRKICALILTFKHCSRELTQNRNSS